MNNVVALISSGRRGTRHDPLTQYRATPPVPLAGEYRRIDILMSNGIHSGLSQMYVLTQFLSVSLHRHIRQAYRFDQFRSGLFKLLAAQRTAGSDDEFDWYQRTADAVRKNIRYAEQPGSDQLLILSGDQLYRMDYRDLARTHIETGANASLARLAVLRSEASGLGIMKLDDEAKINGFVAKDVRIGRGISTVNSGDVYETPELPLCMIRAGLPLILKGAVLPDDWSLQNDLLEHSVH
ncbi:hypothetical protein GC176_07570 [bacterium]|nr:hypothetical protein [bacterium]